MKYKKDVGYKDTYKNFEGGIKSLKWLNYDSAATRYIELTKDIDFSNKSILDVGCGFGDIIPYIRVRTDVFRYTGIDIMADFIRDGRKRFPEHTFEELDYFKTPSKEHYDIIMCSGALNSQQKNAIVYRKKCIKIMFDHSNYATAFNMAGNSKSIKDTNRIHYADSKEILDYCFTLTNKIILRQNYHDKDFTIILYK